MTDEHLPVEKVYQKKTQIEHILLRPDSYVGSIEANEQQMWILGKGEEKFKEKTISFVPGLYKIFGKCIQSLKSVLQMRYWLMLPTTSSVTRRLTRSK